MGVLDDVRKWLYDIPLWKELSTIPDRTTALEKKIAELEEKLGGKWPPDVCRKCGGRTLRLEASMGPYKGIVEEQWRCTDPTCNNYEMRAVKAR